MWRFLFIVVAFLVIFWQMWRGWRLGLPRTIAGAAAIIAAYAAAFFGGPLLVPMLRPVAKFPDFILTAVGGAGIGLIAYGLVTLIGASAFKRTRDQKNPIMHFVYGASGAVVGLVVGVVLVWVMLVAVRLLGTVAESQFQPGTSAAVAQAPANPAATPVADGSAPDPLAGPTRVASFMVKLKNSVEMGPGSIMMRMVDPIPDDVYRITRKVTLLIQSPESAERFLNYPGARELSGHPKILALTENARIRELIAKRDMMGLFQNDKIIEAANDPELAEKLKRFPLEKALDYSLGPATPATPPRAQPLPRV
jgi:hypothetical protein